METIKTSVIRPVPAQDKFPLSLNLKKSLSHPCFNGCGGKNTRIHLPVAPSCNIQCNYCVRKYDCLNESRPGITSKILSPEEAVNRYLAAKKRLGNIDVAGIAGPGDALAEFEKTRETFLRLRETGDPVTFCLSTNGLALPLYAEELAGLGVSHVTVTVNAVDPAIGKRIYRYVEFQGKRLTGEAAAALLLANQMEGIPLLTELGIVCKVNIVMIKGINDAHIPAVVEKVRALGAGLTNIMQLIPVKGSLFEHIPLISHAEITEMREKCGGILPQMYHCRQCRADAVGTLDDDISRTFEADKNAAPPCYPEAKKHSGPPIRFAVSSKDGYLVNQHFGHARELYIYEHQNGQVNFIEKREVLRYCGDEKGCTDHEKLMLPILQAIHDCSCVIAMRIGEIPRLMLAEKGVKVYMTYNYIVDAVREGARSFHTLET
ncbi:MAG: radical SAM protein [Treponema sp.]|jgi:MoaA/NifB/PqqE/SkfB family radical SAM enzyme|nr:radical SAM protein [Treponema sp.]